MAVSSVLPLARKWFDRNRKLMAMRKSEWALRPANAEMEAIGNDDSRLYKRVAAQLIDQLQSGVFSVGDKMPAERDLAVSMGVSRPVVREAMLALEVLGLIEVRLGAGTFVTRMPGETDAPRFNISPFELLEARLVIEGEAAALAAVHVTDEEIAKLESLVEAIREQNEDHIAEENADMAFHLAIARATRNSAMEKTVEDLWIQRWASAECKLLLEQARTANVLPVVEEHTAIVEALRDRDPSLARAAMRAHLEAVIQHLLFAVEEKALAEARSTVAKTRARFSGVSQI